MKLSDIMSAAQLQIYAEVGLVLFLLAFLAVTLRLFRPGRREDWSSLSELPLADEVRSTKKEEQS